MMSDSSRARKLTHTGLYLALCILLPLGLHQLGPLMGRVWLPMHVPVLLAGFLVGPLSGLVVGLLAPTLSHLLIAMPPGYAVPLMSLELPIYGLIAGMAYMRLRLNIYIALLAAMILGRIAFGLGLFMLGMFMELPYDVAFFFSAAGPILTGLPGMAVQIVVIPVLVASVKRRRRLGRL